MAKNKQTHTPFVSGLTETLGTISQQRREHLGFCAENTRNMRSCLVYYSVSVWNQLWASNITRYWPHAVPSSKIFARLLQTCLGVRVPGTGRFRKKRLGRAIPKRAILKPGIAVKIQNEIITSTTIIVGVLYNKYYLSLIHI